MTSPQLVVKALVADLDKNKYRDQISPDMTDELLHVLCWRRTLRGLPHDANDLDKQSDITSTAIRVDVAWYDIGNGVPVRDFAALKVDVNSIIGPEPHKSTGPIAMDDLVYVKSARRAISNFAYLKELDPEMRSKVINVLNQLDTIWSHSLFIEPMDLSEIRAVVEFIEPSDAREAFEDEKNETRHKEEQGVYIDKGQDILDHERYEDETEEEAMERRDSGVRIDDEWVNEQRIVTKWAHLFVDVKTHDDLLKLDDMVDKLLETNQLDASELNLAICLFALKLG